MPDIKGRVKITSIACSPPYGWQLGSFGKLVPCEIIVQYSMCGPEVWRIGSSGQPKQTYLSALTTILHDEASQSIVARLCKLGD